MCRFDIGRHFIGDDPHRYRLAEEEEQARGRDCIERLRTEVLAAKVLSEEELSAIDARAAELVDEAVASAEAAPWPQAAELTTNVFPGG